MLLLDFPSGPEWLLVIVGLVYVGALIYFIYSLWQRADINTQTKLLWTIFLMVAPLVALIVYALFGRAKRGSH